MVRQHMVRLASTFFLLIFLVSQSFGQSYGNSHPFDFKKFNLGFLMGLTYNGYNLKEQINVVDDGIVLNRITKVPKYGINLGIISNYNFAKQVNLRFVPTISLEQRDFNYLFANDSLVVRKIEASYLNLPIMFQFKTKYYKAVRMYVLAGGQIGFNLSSNKKVINDDNLLKISTHDISLNFGFGFNLYGDRIKLSPEIMYSLGVINIYQPEHTSHAYAIQRLSSQVISFNINFE
ncbi:MAG: porin family protein [Bacteroidota bacterium]